MMTNSRSTMLLASVFIVAGSMHFVIPAQYISITPSWVPYAAMTVFVSGILEIAGGVGLLLPPLRRLAGLGLIALLVAVFPANIQMLRDAIADGASSLEQTLLWLRLPLQPLLIYWVYRATMRQPSSAAR